MSEEKTEHAVWLFDILVNVERETLGTIMVMDLEERIHKHGTSLLALLSRTERKSPGAR